MMAEDEAEETGQAAPPTCQWCGTLAEPAATRCSGCGAALATRESLGEVVVPGVTGVDSALAAYDAQPWHLPKASPSQGLAGGTMAAAAIGGPVGIAALGGLAAVAAVEYLGASQDEGRGAPKLEDVGRPSEAAIRMAEQLDAGVVGPVDDLRDGSTASEPGPATDPEAPGE